MKKVLFLLTFLSGAAFAATLTVCASGCGYTTVQAAYNAASSGDTIMMRTGEVFAPLNATRDISNLLFVADGWPKFPGGVRVTEAMAANMATIRASGSTPALQIFRTENPIAENGVNTTTDVITFSSGADIVDGTEMVCWAGTDGSMPAPLVNRSTYFIRDASGSTAKLALTSGGAAIDITSVGSASNPGYYVRPRCTPVQRAKNITFRGIKFDVNSSDAPGYLVQIGDNSQPRPDLAPRGVRLQHVIVESPDGNIAGVNFGVAFAAGGDHVLEDSMVVGSKATGGVESKAVWAQNADNVLIRNNYIAGASINVLTAGGDSAMGRPVTGFSLIGNFIEKPGKYFYKEGSGAPTGECYYGGGSGAFYRRTDVTQTCADGACYTCQSNGSWALDSGAIYRGDDYLTKNLVELKDCVGCLIQGNLMRGSYLGPDAGQGGCFSMTVGFGPGFGAGWHRNHDVRVLDNQCDQTYSGIYVGNGSGGSGSGFDQVPTKNVTLRNFLITNGGRFPALSQWPDTSAQQRIGVVLAGGADGLVVDRVTTRPAASNAAFRRVAQMNPGAWTTNQITGLTFSNVIGAFESGQTAFNIAFPPATTGDCSAAGIGNWVAIDANKKFSSLVMFGGNSSADFLQKTPCTDSVSQGISFAADNTAMGFTSDTNARLTGASPYIAAGTGGSVPGADIDAIESVQNGQAASKRIRWWRSGTTVQVDLDDPGSACTVNWYPTQADRQRRQNALTPTSTTTVSRRTVTATQSGTAWGLVLCGTDVWANSL